MTVYLDPSRSSFGQRREAKVVIKSARNEEMFDTEETKLKKRKAELESKRDIGINLNSYERAELKEINKKLEDINKLKKREHEISKMIKSNNQQPANIIPNKLVSESARNLLGSIFDKPKENK